MRLRVSFIAPRQLGAVGVPFGRQFLPSVGWHTGQSGAPPDMNSACPVPDLLPFLAKPTVAPSVLLAHRQSSATNWPLAQATRRPLIALLRAPRGGWIGDPVKTWNLQTWLSVGTMKSSGYGELLWTTIDTVRTSTRDTEIYPVVRPSTTLA
jgi:hypothetical protein